MQRYLRDGRPFPWRKAGLVFDPTGTPYTHGSHPCAVQVAGDELIVAFTRRDSLQRSHIFLSRSRVSPNGMTLLGQPALALRYGEPGDFDCDGAISVCFAQAEGRTYLYYVGWKNLPDGRWLNHTGRSILDPEALTLTREGSLHGLGEDQCLFSAATAVRVTGHRWQTWYNREVRWENRDDGWHHWYGIHYAESADGFNWIAEPGMCIPFADEHEYAFGRPTVSVSGGIYCMWFAHRATKTTSAYRLGFACSADGRHWNRNDALAGLDVSSSGWDAEMICYPYVFESGGRMYMLYNGNDYGRTGFGIAVMETP